MIRHLSFWLAAALFLAGCSFDYNLEADEEDKDPDIVMKNVEYVRISRANPVIRLQAKEARRYEEKHLMELDQFTFEQYAGAPAGAGPQLNLYGTAGTASIQTDTGNLSMDGGVSIGVTSENLSILTQSLTWQDKERLLAAPGDVNITRGDGTKLFGSGFSADIRRRSWQFERAVAGDIVEESLQSAENEEVEQQEH
jgi:LPS export ABC transporter protein LptC